MRERYKTRQIKEREEREKKWAKMERNQPRNIIIVLILFFIMALLVVYRRISGA